MADRLPTALLCILSLLAVPAAADDRRPVFDTDVQPILVDKCGKCHSEKVRKGGLDLSSLAALRAGGESGEPLVAESIDDSLLWTLLEGRDMPPADEPALDVEQLDVLRQWIVSMAGHAGFDAAASGEITHHDVIPIMLLRCTTCHGPRLQENGLDLRAPAAMLTGGISGPALIPGDPEASLMIQRIASGACPPRERLLKDFVRRPPQSEVQTLRRWIAAGAPQADIRPDVATTSPDPLVTDADRQHWAFRPPVAADGVNSIDQFVGRRLRKAGLSFSPRADRDALIRRAYFDLTGLPPSLAQWHRWRDDRRPDWYARMVDALLASPRYGERWGRYWLDLAGYADSEGGVSADPIRPVAWKYRDYVIASFNSDKPYDRFLHEQLAGDELIDCENANVVTQEMVDNLIATGFLRMGIDETGSRTMNFVPERLKVISDAITVVASGLMALTMECARCHSHKYDPIPQRDYYRFKAIFQGALDEHDWSSFKTRRLSIATQEQRQLVAAINPPLQSKIKKLQSQRRKLSDQISLELLRHHYPGQSESDNRATLVAEKKADNQRSLTQRKLVERLQRAQLRPDDVQPDQVRRSREQLDRLGHEIDRLRRRMVAPLEIRALWDLGRPSPTYVLRRGEHNRPGDLVGPGVPSVLTDGKTPLDIQPPFPGGAKKTGRRLALARWLTRPDHPLTARVIVNRIWYHHFGTGLVKELDNFGVQGGRPSHPQLLDWLSVELVSRGWSIKSMHRLIMNSRTYRQSSRVTERRRRLDPDNRLLSRMALRRLDAEALRDSLLLVSGSLDDRPGGIPDTVSVSREGQVRVNPTDGNGWRRSVYLQYRRTEIPTLMDTFDYPKMGPNCVARNVSTVSPQSLILMNNRHIRQLAGNLAARVAKMSVGRQPEQLVETVYALALSRRPSKDERRIGIDSLAKLQGQWQGSEHRALETYCHTILNSAAFLYID